MLCEIVSGGEIDVRMTCCEKLTEFTILDDVCWSVVSVTHLTMRTLEFDERIIHNNMRNDIPNFRDKCEIGDCMNGCWPLQATAKIDALASSAVPSRNLHSIFAETFQGMVS